MINIYTVGMAVTLIMIILFPTDNNCCNSQNKIRTIKWNKKLVSLLSIILWGGIAAFRAVSVGTDTLHYSEIFQRIGRTGWADLTQDIEFSKFPIYIIYNKIVSIFSTNANAITFTNSLIFVIGVILFLYYNSDNLGVSIYCFLALHYYLLALNIARESLAIMLVLWAFHFAIRNKYIKALIINILAIGIHYTAALGLIVLFIAAFCKKSKDAYIFLILCSLVVVFFRQIILFAVKIFPQYGDYVNGDGDFSLFDNSSEGRRSYIALFLLIVFVFCWIYPRLNKKTIEKDKKYWIYVTLSIIAIEFMVIYGKSNLMARMELYFSYFFMLSIPHFVEKAVHNNDKVFIYAIIFIVLFVPFYLKLKDYLPYELFFS